MTKVGGAIYGGFKYGEEIYGLVVYQESINSNAYILKSGSEKSLYSNAYINEEYQKNLNSNAYVLKETLKTLNSDAYILKTTQKTLTSDTYILKEIITTLNSDAYILADYVDGLNSDAYILKSYDNSLTSDSYILKESSTTIDSDAFILKSYKDTLYSDAYILKSYQDTLNSDAYVLKSGEEESLYSDAYILQSYDKNLNSDAYILKITQTTLDSDALILQSYSNSLDSDAYILTSYDENINSNIYILQSYDAPLDSNYYLLKRTTTEIKSDAYILKEDVEASLLSNAWIKRVESDNTITSYCEISLPDFGGIMDEGWDELLDTPEFEKTVTYRRYDFDEDNMTGDLDKSSYTDYSINAEVQPMEIYDKEVKSGQLQVGDANIFLPPVINIDETTSFKPQINDEIIWKGIVYRIEKLKFERVGMINIFADCLCKRMGNQNPDFKWNTHYKTYTDDTKLGRGFS